MVQQSNDFGAERLNGLFSIMTEELSVYGSEPAFQRQVQRMRKRAQLGVKGLDLVARDNFLRSNDRVRDTPVTLDRVVEHNARLFITEAFERYNSRFDPECIQIAYDPRHLDRFWRFGPGASNGITGKHTAEKLYQPMTCTLLAMPLVRRLRAKNVYLASYDIGSGRPGVEELRGSRLSTVPKNEETKRTIAIEPSGNMALQLAFGCYTEAVLKSLGLDIKTQQAKNKALAREGSLTGRLATIDLKAASDSISIDLVRRIWPAELFDLMLRLRSPCIEVDGDYVELHMISTMGNGFTFPVMTMSFLALIYGMRVATNRIGRRNWVDWTTTGVYGDDIIVPTDEVADLLTVLHDAGFLVNLEKSFWEGPFRESCGGDYWDGIDITPFYVKNLATDAEIYVAINKMFEWCAKVGRLLPRSLVYLSQQLRGPMLFVPEWHGNDAGFRTSQVSRRYNYLRPKTQLVGVKDPHFSMMLAVGGYFSGEVYRSLDSTARQFYTPRPDKTRYRVRRTRLPSGYLDGRDPLSRPAQVSDYVQSYSFLFG